MGSKSIKKIKVVFFNRKPRSIGNYSLEIYFQLIQNHLKEDFEVVNKVMPYENNGFYNRVANAIYCMKNQGDVNHITGEIHYVAAFLKKSKTILTVLDCGMLHDSVGLKHKLLNYFWFDMPFRKSKIITAISNATKEDILNFTSCDAKKISVIYVCISPQFKEVAKVFDTENPRILQIGTAHNKNLRRLIPALKGIKCTLVIIGKIDQETKDLIAQNNINLELFDRRLSDEEILLQYEKCDILSLVSTLEGFGMPIVEANAIGRVCITGNTTSMPEIAGNAAHIVDPFDVQQIHDGILLLIQDKDYREKLIINGFENANKYSPASLAKQYSLLYKSIGTT